MEMETNLSTWLGINPIPIGILQKKVSKDKNIFVCMSLVKIAYFLQTEDYN